MRILMLTHRLPYAPNRGDRIRAFHLLHALREQFEVDLVSLVHDADEAAQAGTLAGPRLHVTIAPVPHLRTRARAALALTGQRPLTHCLLSSPSVEPALARLMSVRPPDLAFAYCSGMARYALAPPLDRVPLVLDMVDVDSEKWHSLAASSAYPKRWVFAREHTTLRAFERRAIAAAAATVVVNERERETLHGIDPSARIEVVPNGVDTDHFRNPGEPADAPVATFVGVMNYAPNEAAAIWAARDVWPRVLAQRPDAKLWIVGSQPTPAVQALASSSVRVTGGVADTRPLLWSSAIGLAPLATARGVQNKVLEAVAAGLPVVVTPVVEEGLPLEIAGTYRVADSADTFSRQVLELLRLSPGERRAMAARAALTSLKWSTRLAPLGELCRWAATQPASSH